MEKPARLDPNSYGSLDEIAQWRSLLQQFKDKAAQIDGLYRGLEKNLDLEVKNSKVAVDPVIVSKFKTILLRAFPWDTIHKKGASLTHYTDKHQKLFDFYHNTCRPSRPAGKH